MDPLYQIFTFSEDNLATALSSKIAPEKVKERLHFFYLRKYLSKEKGIGAETIIIEKEYISKAFITDYSNYYATCFQDYERKCSRIHFFDVKISEEVFQKELLDSKSRFLSDHYLGYVVVKPLPDSILGPTLLGTYKKRKDDHARFYPVSREYKVNLFGKELLIETLPYQEQDTVVSACASVAVWSAFHQTSWLFRTNLPSPSEITKLAGNLFINYGRTYPNSGLDLTQICRAIDAVGLVSELRSSPKFEQDINLATRIIYSYLKACIPVLLLIKEDPKSRDGHAITVTGYSEPKKKESEESKKPKPEISLLADRIDKFYIHDDQLGPFAKYTFSGQTALLKHTWDDNGTEKTESAWIHAAIIPLYPKIRIKYEDVFETTAIIDRIFYEVDLFLFELEWDIFLIESNKYKKELLESELDENLKKQKIIRNYPKYIWIARAQFEDVPLFDFVFDSTDIPTGPYCIDFILHEPVLSEYLFEIFDDARDIFIDDVDGPRLGNRTFDLIMQQLTPAQGR
jgi:hypothetical protein